MTTTAQVDLTPFGFTPTESLVYASLLELGPTSAYAVSKKLSLARANAYQALNGLREKGAARLIESDPQVFRAAHPDALLVMITDRDLAKLDRLEQQLAQPSKPETAETQPFSSERAFKEIALRTAARAQVVRCLARGAVLLALNPIWRKRAADGRTSRLWVLGDDEPDVAIAVSGRAALPDDLSPLLGPNPVLLLADDAAIMGHEDEGEFRGYWSSERIFRALAEGTFGRITATSA